MACAEVSIFNSPKPLQVVKIQTRFSDFVIFCHLGSPESFSRNLVCILTTCKGFGELNMLNQMGTNDFWQKFQNQGVPYKKVSLV